MTAGKYKLFVACFSFLFAVSMCFTSFADFVWAENSDNDPTGKKELITEESEIDNSGEGQGVHADHHVFEKNFCLSVDEKEYTITEIEKVISYYLKPEMSDLEK